GSMRMIVERVEGDTVTVLWAHEGQIGRDALPAFALNRWEERAQREDRPFTPRPPREDRPFTPRPPRGDHGGRDDEDDRPARPFGGDRKGGGKPFGAKPGGFGGGKPGGFGGKPGMDGRPRPRNFYRKDD
ncbi:MAG: hypothetical protein ACK4WC_16760, partial [Rubrimonas sp.]